MSEPIMEEVKGDGVKINLAKWEGSRGPILCVHGITANCRCWDVMANILAPEYRVLAMDLRGRGRSEKPDEGYNLETHLRDMNGLMDDLEIDRAVVMGHSLGAYIGLAFAAKYPERVDRLILIDGGGDLSQEQIDQAFASIKPALDRLQHIFPSIETYLEAMRQAPFIQPWSPATEIYFRHEIETTDDGVRTNIQPSHIAEEAGNIRQVKFAAFYPQVQCPVLILRAPLGLLSENDILLPEDAIERMIREIPDARRFDVNGMNHYGIVFHPHEARNQAIKGFLEGL
jgi:pimeloyl-ACP methyl ester carboxylesterase